MAEKKLYKVRVEGEYYAFSAGQKAVKPYELEFMADAHMKKMGVLSCFRNALSQSQGSQKDSVILKAMRAKYPDYRRFRTHEVTEVVDVTANGKPVEELSLMNRHQIVAYINRKGLPIEPDLYTSVSDLRQAMRSYREAFESNRVEEFVKKQDRRAKAEGPRIQAANSLERLNTNLLNPQPQQTHEDPSFVEPEPKDPVTYPGPEEPKPSNDEDSLGGIPEFDDIDEMRSVIDGI